MENINLKQLISKEINKTEELIKMYSEDTKPVAPDCSIDLITRNDAMNNMNITNSSFKQAQSKLAALEYILSTVGTSGFGRCKKCRKKIPIGRVLARSESLYCIQCSQ